MAQPIYGRPSVLDWRSVSTVHYAGKDQRTEIIAAMDGRTRTRTVRTLPSAALTLLGLSAIITGILAMHVWMGGHGPSAHGSPVPGSLTHSSSIYGADIGSPTSTGGQHQAQTNTAHATDFQGSTGDPTQGCVASCGDEGVALGMCLLAIIIVGILAFLVGASRLVPGSVLLRGPPLIRLRPLSIPVPSLITLCISRT